MEKSAVEWLVEQIRNNKFVTALEQIEAIDQAKIMEKQQIENAFESGDLFSSSWFDGINETSTNYYNETFKTK